MVGGGGGGTVEYEWTRNDFMITIPTQCIYFLPILKYPVHFSL